MDPQDFLTGGGGREGGREGGRGRRERERGGEGGRERGKEDERTGEGMYKCTCVLTLHQCY